MVCFLVGRVGFEEYEFVGLLDVKLTADSLVFQMITKNFEDYPEHRLKFFSLLRAIASHCFRALFTLSSQVSEQQAFHVSRGYLFVGFVEEASAVDLSFLFDRPLFWSSWDVNSMFCVIWQQLKLVMDSIIWAFRHTERNVAETGLNLLLEMLTNFQVIPHLGFTVSSRPPIGSFVCFVLTHGSIFSCSDPVLNSILPWVESLPSSSSFFASVPILMAGLNASR
jgi:hypothetical protein